jgi:hypothetical protein
VAAVTSASAPAPQVHRVDSSLRGTLSLTRGAWSLRPKAQGFWGGEELLIIGEGDRQPVVLRLWKTGTLGGRLGTGGITPLPEVLDATFEPAASSSADSQQSTAEPRGTVSCPVEHARWSCDLPAQKLNVRLHANNFSSHYYWGIQVASTQRTELGQARILPVASVVGKVRTRLGPALGAQVSIVSPDGRAIKGGKLQSKNDTKNLAQLTNPVGFYQILDVPPGEF